MPRGRKPRAKAVVAPEPADADTLAALLLSAPPERQEQLRDAIWDRACGHRWWSGEWRKPGGRDIGAKQRKVTLTDADTGEVIEGWIYEIPGDPLAQKLLVEHGIGRPGVRELTKTDAVINLIHRVPNRRDRVTAGTEPEPEPEVVADDAVALGGEVFGIGSIMGTEPEDDG